MVRWRRRITSCLTGLAGLLTAAASAHAQEVRDYGTTTRGLVRSGADMAEAAALLARTSVSCTITDARLRGRDERGLSQYEVACESGPGFYILLYPEVTAVSCLALSARREARAPECRLPANRNALGHYRRAALAAGVGCDVDRGRYVGLTLGGGEIYEVGCDGGGGRLGCPQSRGLQFQVVPDRRGRGRDLHPDDPGRAPGHGGAAAAGQSGRGLHAGRGALHGRVRGDPAL